MGRVYVDEYQSRSPLTSLHHRSRDHCEPPRNCVGSPGLASAPVLLFDLGCPPDAAAAFSELLLFIHYPSPHNDLHQTSCCQQLLLKSGKYGQPQAVMTGWAGLKKSRLKAIACVLTGPLSPIATTAPGWNQDVLNLASSDFDHLSLQEKASSARTVPGRARVLKPQTSRAAAGICSE
jgi:hypothetical protein